MSTSTSSEPGALKRFLQDAAAEEGFAALRITRPGAIPNARPRLAEFLKHGRHATMVWMAETEARRADPQVLWPDVRSVAVLAMDYAPSRDPLDDTVQDRRAAIAGLCQGP